MDKYLLPPTVVALLECVAEVAFQSTGAASLERSLVWGRLSTTAPFGFEVLEAVNAYPLYGLAFGS